MADETTTGATDTATQSGATTESTATETLLGGATPDTTATTTQTTKVDDAPAGVPEKYDLLSLIHISEPTRRHHVSRMPSSA